MRSPREEFVRGLPERAPYRRRALMKPLTVLITGLQVLAHSVFGCCAHAEREGVDCTPSGHCHHASEAVGRELAHQHLIGPPYGPTASSSAADDHRNSDPRPEHQCPHDACQWIVQKDAAPEGHVNQLAYLPALAHADDRLTGNPLTILQSAPPPIAALPVRLHLWVGVLLI